jgi:hypothetical protein
MAAKGNKMTWAVSCNSSSEMTDILGTIAVLIFRIWTVDPKCRILHTNHTP